MPATNRSMNKTEASEIVESDKPLIGLIQHFGSGSDALRFYAERMTHRFRGDGVGMQCCSCKRNSVSRVQAFHWRALVNPKFAFTRLDALLLLAGRVGMTLQHTMIDFATVHGFCDSCAATVKRNRLFSVVIKSVAFFTLIVCIGMVLIGGGAVVVMSPDPKDRNEFLICFLVGVFGLIASTFGHVWERRLRIPPPLRMIGRKPFYLEKVTEFDTSRGN